MNRPGPNAGRALPAAGVLRRAVPVLHFLFIAASSTLAGPIVITHGGEYHGPYSSAAPSVAAVTIQTTEPVTLDHCTITGPGPLIVDHIEHADLTVRDCTGTGVNPNTRGKAAGRFISLEAFDRLLVEHCELDQTCGIYLYQWHGHGDAPIRILNNRAKNIDGRRSDGHGGYLPFNLREDLTTRKVESGFDEVQFLQLNAIHAPGIEVAWNYVTNEPGLSRVEDNVNLFKSGGTPASPMLIRNNCIRGAFTVSPAARTTQDHTTKFDWNYTGGGIMLGDGLDAVGAVSSYVIATDNVVIGTSNYGIGIAAGHDISFSRNVIVSSGKLPDGNSIFAQNVGAYIWDEYHGKQLKPSSFFNNRGSENSVRWMNGNHRADSWTPDAELWTGNTRAAGDVTVADEDAAERQWLEGCKRLGLHVGVQARP